MVTSEIEFEETEAMYSGYRRDGDEMAEHLEKRYANYG